MFLDTLVPAFVLKNFSKTGNKVIIFHKRLGKITCVYGQKEQARYLCTGAFIFCAVEKKRNYYTFVHMHVDFVPLNYSLETLSFIHDILRICLSLLPSNIAVYELFDYLMYMHQNISKLTNKSKSVILLRIFLLFDLLPKQKKMYQYALQDPYGIIDQSVEDLQDSVRLCWHRFEHEIEQLRNKK